MSDHISIDMSPRISPGVSGQRTSDSPPANNTKSDSSDGTESKRSLTTKTLKRRGNTYEITDDDDGVLDTMIDDLYIEALSLSSAATARAGVLKFLTVSASIFMIIAGAIIGVLTLESHKDNVSICIASILGFSITAIQTALSTFSIERRSVLLKQISLKLREIARELKTLEASEINPGDKMKRVQMLYDKVDKLDLGMFDHTITTNSFSQATNIGFTDKQKPRSQQSKEGDHDEQEKSILGLMNKQSEVLS